MGPTLTASAALPPTLWAEPPPCHPDLLLLHPWAEDPALHCLQRRHRGRVCRQNRPRDPGATRGSRLLASRTCGQQLPGFPSVPPWPTGDPLDGGQAPLSGPLPPWRGEARRPRGATSVGCVSSEALHRKMQVGARIQALGRVALGALALFPGSWGARRHRLKIPGCLGSPNGPRQAMGMAVPEPVWKESVQAPGV